MLFNSIQFLFFFIIVTVTYFTIPHKYRWALLLIASCYFYMAFVPIYILILGFTIIIDYIAGILIEESQNNRKKAYLVISLLANIGVLSVFKYFNFINENLTSLFLLTEYKNPIPYLNILLPIGLSFHTFQAMSYTIEVYRGNQKAERHFGIYSLYVMFFPQLVAGPIERPQNLLHQFYEKHYFNYTNAVWGLRLILWGLFKKLVIADRLGLYVDAAYNNPSHQNGTTLFIATVFFAFQIYCDFSGYSDIAIGSARIMGFNLMTNFNRPYFSKSISEFWKRWHISLSTWFKDYLYISLGGNRVPVNRIYLNLLIVFLVSGLWHGANWTYVIWGALNGFYLVFGMIVSKHKIKINNILFINRHSFIEKFISITTTFILIDFSWIFFRANSFSDAILIIRKLFSDWGRPLDTGISTYLYSILAILILIIIEYKNEFLHSKSIFAQNNPTIRYFTYAIAVIIILLIGVFDGGQFIYFQF